MSHRKQASDTFSMLLYDTGEESEFSGQEEPFLRVAESESEK